MRNRDGIPGIIPPDSWTPPEPPAIGSKGWLDNMAFTLMCETFKGLPDKSGVFKLPKVECGGETYDMGYFAVFHSSAGHNYFRTDSIEDIQVKTRILE